MDYRDGRDADTLTLIIQNTVSHLTNRNALTSYLEAHDHDSETANQVGNASDLISEDARFRTTVGTPLNVGFCDHS